MSAHISGSGGDYFGVLNGVAYRINCDADALSHGLLRLVPLKLEPAAARGCPVELESAAPARAEPQQAAAAPAIPMDAAAAPDLLMEQARAEREARKSKLFKREGDEPLRAGHPDLWALLVAGTCLEGSRFQRL